MTLLPTVGRGDLSCWRPFLVSAQTCMGGEVPYLPLCLRDPHPSAFGAGRFEIPILGWSDIETGYCLLPFMVGRLRALLAQSGPPSQIAFQRFDLERLDSLLVKPPSID